MARQLSEALHSSEQPGDGFSGAEAARALRSVAKEAEGKKGAKGGASRRGRDKRTAARMTEGGTVDQASDYKGPLEGPATPEELSNYAKEVQDSFNELSVSTESQLMSSANTYNDILDADGKMQEPGVIDSSITLAADGRRVVLSRSEFGDIVLKQMQEAAHRISSGDAGVEDRYIFVPAAEASAFLTKMTADKDIKEAGFVADKELARMAAERELAPRAPIEVEKERGRVDQDILKFQLDRLEGTSASGLVAGPESDLVDPEVTKSKLIEQARAKLEHASNRVQAAVDLGNRAGNAASSEFLAIRQEASEAVANIVLELNRLSSESAGHLVVLPLNNQEANDAVFEKFTAMVKQASSPFLERNIKDESTGILVKELYYHTGQPNQVVVESWNNASGGLIMVTLVQSDHPTIIKPMTRYRSELRSLIGKKPKIELLSSQAEAELRSARPSSDVAYESSGGSGDYGPIAGILLQENLTKMHPTNVELAKNIKPKRRVSWMEKLFGNSIAR